MKTKKGPANAALPPSGNSKSEIRNPKRASAQLRVKKKRKAAEKDGDALERVPPGVERPLSARQEKFCVEFMNCDTATEAYRRAYGNTRTAEAAASRLLTSVKVKERIAALQERAALGAVLSRQALLEWLTRGIVTPLGRVDEESDLCQAAEYNVTGGVRGKLRQGTAARGNEEEEPEMTVVKIKMVDRMRAGELLAKLQGWLTEKHEVKHAVDPGLIELLARIGG